MEPNISPMPTSLHVFMQIKSLLDSYFVYYISMTWFPCAKVGSCEATLLKLRVLVLMEKHPSQLIYYTITDSWLYHFQKESKIWVQTTYGLLTNGGRCVVMMETVATLMWTRVLLYCILSFFFDQCFFAVIQLDKQQWLYPTFRTFK